MFWQNTFESVLYFQNTFESVLDFQNTFESVFWQTTFEIIYWASSSILERNYFKAHTEKLFRNRRLQENMESCQNLFFGAPSVLPPPLFPNPVSS